MNRALRRQKMRIVQKMVDQKMGAVPAAKAAPARGFGFTITNKTVAILCWSRVFTIWRAK